MLPSSQPVACDTFVQEGYGYGTSWLPVLAPSPRSRMVQEVSYGTSHPLDSSAPKLRARSPVASAACAVVRDHLPACRSCTHPSDLSLLSSSSSFPPVLIPISCRCHHHHSRLYPPSSLPLLLFFSSSFIDISITSVPRM